MTTEPFEMLFRDRWCRIFGWVEPADHTVGILVSVFCVDEIQEYGLKGGGGRLYSAAEIEALTGTELAEIDAAYWAQDDGDYELTPEDLTAGPRRARLGGPASWVARVGRWLGALTGRKDT